MVAPVIVRRSSVDRLERVRDPLRLGRIVLEQQRHRELGVGDATGGVEPRRDAEREVPCAGLRGRLGRARKQGTKPGLEVTASSSRPSRTMARLSPVIGAMSAIVPIAATPAEVGGRLPAAREQRGCQLEGEAGAGQVGIGVGAVGTVRIDHRHRERQRAGRQVVVRDDDLHPEAARLLDLDRVRRRRSRR